MKKIINKRKQTIKIYKKNQNTLNKLIQIKGHTSKLVYPP